MMFLVESIRVTYMDVIPEDVSASSTEAQRSARNKNLRSAVVTSLVARAAGILLQVLSLPIAAAALGPEGFIVYSMVGATLAWLTLSNIGIGQATTLHIGLEIHHDLRNKILVASWASTLVVSMSALLLTGGLAVFTELIPRIFSAHTSDFRTVYYSLSFIVIVFIATQNLSVFEAAQLACQRQDRLNVAISIGTTMAAIAVYVVAKKSPTVLHILLAVHVPVIAMRIVNAVGVVKIFKIKADDFFALRWTEMRELFKDGISFLSGSTLSNFLCHPFSILVVGATTSAMASASFAAVMNAVVLASSLFGLVMTPVRGALPEAAKKSDTEWIRRAYYFALTISVAYSLVPCFLFSIVGQKIFEIWYGGTISPQELTLVPAGVYVACLAVEVTNYNFLSSLGCLKQASRWLLSKSIAAAALTWVLAETGHADLVFWGLVITSFAFSLIPLSWIIYRLIKAKPRSVYA